MFNYGGITTYGQRAYGILAQSIGGGGGSGGEASSSSSGETVSVNLNLGGSGGAASSGGAVAVTTNGGVYTSGYGATAVVAQSIGGGGGVAASGSISKYSSFYLGSSNGSGLGGAVTVNQAGLITTQGDDAHGILAQSIGGGGGLASAGCTNSVHAGPGGGAATACFGNTGVPGSRYGSNSSLHVLSGGEGSNNTASGGPVTVSIDGSITTTGARSFGVIAQSIGDGGGILTTTAANLLSARTPNWTGTVSPGGNITVTLAESGSITTYGAGAWGMLAQSIGGGGGLVGDPSLPLLITAPGTGSGNDTKVPTGGAVNITSAGNITTTGANAHGIVAQSVVGGGVLINSVDNNRYSWFGAASENMGYGGAIIINQTGGTISASGPGSIGILAQSSGNSNNASLIQIMVGGNVIGGSGVNAAGINVSGGGFPGSANSVSANTVTIYRGGSVSAMDGISGNAIVAAAFGHTNVVNNGTITGNVILGSNAANAGDFTNNGVFNSGPNVVVASQTLTNNGLINIGGAGSIGTTVLTGGINQTPGGRLVIDINSLGAQKADKLVVVGNANIDGTIVPNPIVLLRGTLPILSATGLLSSTVSVVSPLLFNWAITDNANTLALTPTANFTPTSVALTHTQASFAGYLGRAWSNADPFFAATFAGLNQVQSAGAYSKILNASYPGATLAQNNALARSGMKLLGSALSCPIFVGDSTVLGEGSCVWARFTGGVANQYANGGDPGYRVAGTTYRLGGQKEVAPGWFIGGALGAGSNRATANNSSSTGQIFDGSLAVKYLTGDWQFAASTTVASGSFQNTRFSDMSSLPSTPVSSGVLSSASSGVQAGGRLRAAYEFAYTEIYVRPYADLDLINTHTPGFKESGKGWPLSYSAGNQTNVAFSPMVELGRRYDVDGGFTFRGYIDLGASIQSNDRSATTASIIGASAANGGFQSYSTSSPLLGRFNLGVQLYQRDGWEVRAEYGLEAGNHYLGQVGSARLAYDF